MKRVAVQGSMVEIRHQLSKRGYEVVNFEDSGIVDAIVYIDDYAGIRNMNNDGDMEGPGAVIINASNKSIEQIIYIIESRRYEGLFT